MRIQIAISFGFWNNSYSIFQAINKKGILVIPTQEGSVTGI